MALIGWVDTPRTKSTRRSCRAGITLVTALALSVCFLLTFPSANIGTTIVQIGNRIEGDAQPDTLQSCANSGRTWGPAKLIASAFKYEKLLDDKFTIAMQTYKRPKELANTLQVLLAEPIPSLLEVVVVWNDLEADPPLDFFTQHGVKVRHRKSKRNSLNEKLWPDPEYGTKAILLSDDDVYYHPSDLEFVFQTWRKFGQNRLTGALARCHKLDAYGLWEYDFCSQDASEDVYSMILTNLCFAPISFLDFYSSNDPIMGHDNYVNYVPSQGISTKPGHMEARSHCLNDFAEMFTCMPLINETARIERGVIVL